MSASNENMERRSFLKSGAVFGLAAAGLQSAGWASPSLVSFQPPAALGGSGRLFLNGASQLPIPKPDAPASIRFTLTGADLRGHWNIGVVPPPYGMTGLDIDYSVHPQRIEFTGGELEVHEVLVKWTVRKKPGFRKLKPIRTDLAWQLEATPADADSSPITTSHSCTLALSLD